MYGPLKDATSKTKPTSGMDFSEGPSTQHLRTLVAKNHTLNGFWDQSLNNGYLDPLGNSSTETGSTWALG